MSAYWLHTNKKLFAKVHGIVIKEMQGYYLMKAKLAGIEHPHAGSISFTQRARSALNLNPHLHVMLLDGVYAEVNGIVRFRNIDAITDDEVARLCESIAKKVMKHLTRDGYLDQDGEIVENPTMDGLCQDNEEKKGVDFDSSAVDQIRPDTVPILVFDRNRDGIGGLHVLKNEDILLAYVLT